jgi:hypothetical protein
MSVYATAADQSITSVLSPYARFKMALKSKEVKRQYPNLLEKFLDFCKFEGPNIEQKALKFYLFAKTKTQEEMEDLVIRFILFQTGRIDKGEITSGTLRNYVKALKLFCKMNRIGILWDIISHSIPKVKKHANDRIPTVEEIKKLTEYPDRVFLLYYYLYQLA